MSFSELTVGDGENSYPAAPLAGPPGPGRAGRDVIATDNGLLATLAAGAADPWLPDAETERHW
jgi:hypothetical protein